jgi:putative inorganic carbon (HCO3(-)) transporter
MKGLLFTWALTFGGAAASLFRPFIGFLIYVCFAILKPEAMWWWSLTAWHYSRIVAIGLLVGWTFHGWGSWRFGRARAVVAALIGYLMWSAVAAAAAPDQHVAWNFVEKASKIVLPFLAGITLIDSVQKLKQLAWVIALSQGYLAWYFHEMYFDGQLQYGVDALEFAGSDNNSVALGMCACAGLAFFLGLHADNWWSRLAAFASAALMAHSVMFMFSRGGMLGLLLTGIVSVFLIPRQPKHYFYFAVAVVVALALAGQEVRQRFLSAFTDKGERDAAAQNRLDYWGYCIDSIGKRPILGAGPDHWPKVSVSEYHVHAEAHSLWLQVGAEIGIPGLGFLVAFYGLCVLRLYPISRARQVSFDPWLQGAARMVIASIAGFAVAAQFVSLKDLEQPFYVTLVGAGVLRLVSVPAARAWVGPVPSLVSAAPVRVAG